MAVTGSYAKGGKWLRRSTGQRTLLTKSQIKGGGLSGDSEAEIADKAYAERKANADKAKAEKLAALKERTRQRVAAATVTGSQRELDKQARDAEQDAKWAKRLEKGRTAKKSDRSEVVDFADGKIKQAQKQYANSKPTSLHDARKKKFAKSNKSIQEYDDQLIRDSQLAREQMDRKAHELDQMAKKTLYKYPLLDNKPKDSFYKGTDSQRKGKTATQFVS